MVQKRRIHKESTSIYDTWKELCPYCDSVCEADFVDVGVGLVQCGPFHCTSCGASEIGPYDKPRELTADEEYSGWYAPGSEPGSSANVIHGKIVDHEVMNHAYRAEFFQNELYDADGFPEQWWENIRKPVDDD